MTKTELEELTMGKASVAPETALQRIVAAAMERVGELSPTVQCIVVVLDPCAPVETGQLELSFGTTMPAAGTLHALQTLVRTYGRAVAEGRVPDDE